jgi:hypothetical protein
MAIAAAWHRLLCWRAGKEQVVVTVLDEEEQWEAPPEWSSALLLGYVMQGAGGIV